MTNNEVNKIISEYMGVPWCPCNDGIEVVAHDLHPKYTESLDALVPVIEKLDMYHDNYFGKSNSGDDSYCFELVHSQGRHYKCYGKTIQEAAAHVTAICIKGLNND